VDALPGWPDAHETLVGVDHLGDGHLITLRDPDHDDRVDVDDGDDGEEHQPHRVRGVVQP